jgi:hypothetical protein
MRTKFLSIIVILVVIGLNSTSLAIPSQTIESSAHSPDELTEVKVVVGNFGNTDNFSVKRTLNDGTYQEGRWIYKFASFIAIDGVYDRIYQIKDWPTINQTKSTDVSKIGRSTESKVTLADSSGNDILEITYKTTLSGPYPDPSVSLARLRWDVSATLENLRLEMLPIRYYWYLDFDYGGNVYGDSATVEKTAPGYQIKLWDDNTNDLFNGSQEPAYFIDSMPGYPPTRWAIEDTGEYLDEWLTNSYENPYNLTYDDNSFIYPVTFNSINGGMAFQHNIDLYGQAVLKLSPTSGYPIPAPSALLLLVSGLAGVVGLSRKRLLK